MNFRKYLEIALQEAEKASKLNTYPIGAVIVNQKGEILAKTHNESFTKNDATAHAELICIREAGKSVMKNFSTEPTYIFTSLEPCFGCGFFIRYTNIKNIIWAFNDTFKGGVEDLKKINKLSDDFSSITFHSEPYEDLKKRSQELMYEYFVKRGSLETAEHFRVK